MLHLLGLWAQCSNHVVCFSNKQLIKEEVHIPPQSIPIVLEAEQVNDDEASELKED